MPQSMTPEALQGAVFKDLHPDPSLPHFYAFPARNLSDRGQGASGPGAGSSPLGLPNEAQSDLRGGAFARQRQSSPQLIRLCSHICAQDPDLHRLERPGARNQGRPPPHHFRDLGGKCVRLWAAILTEDLIGQGPYKSPLDPDVLDFQGGQVYI